MRLGAEHLGSRLPVVAMVINGSNSGSLPSLALRSASDARRLPLMSITSSLRVTVAPTPSTTSRPYATSATHSRHGMKTASVVVSSSFLRGLKNDHFWSKKGEGRLFCFKRGQSTSRGMRGQRFTILGLFHDVYGVVV
jgi:hypothetical protein